MANKIPRVAVREQDPKVRATNFEEVCYGYNVEELRAEIGHILGVDKKHHLVMIGVGNLGRALLQNFPFAQNGFVVNAAFDISPAIIGTDVNGVPVYAMETLDEYIRTHQVDVEMQQPTLPHSWYAYSA